MGMGILNYFWYMHEWDGIFNQTFSDKTLVVSGWGVELQGHFMRHTSNVCKPHIYNLGRQVFKMQTSEEFFASLNKEFYFVTGLSKFKVMFTLTPNH